jgi:hypothetical protein
MQQNQIDNEEVTISIKTTMNVLKKGFAINIKYDYDTEYETDGDDESVKYETNNKIHICKNIFGDDSFSYPNNLLSYGEFETLLTTYSTCEQAEIIVKHLDIKRLSQYKRLTNKKISDSVMRLYHTSLHHLTSHEQDKLNNHECKRGKKFMTYHAISKFMPQLKIKLLDMIK